MDIAGSMSRKFEDRWRNIYKDMRKWEKEGFVLRLATKEDAEEYYEHNFNPLDSEMVRLTGSKSCYTHDEVVDFFKKCIDSPDRYDFVIIAPDGHIIGESVINEIDEEVRSANFRICLFHSNEFGKGIGSWAIEKTLEFAFDDIKLHRVDLDVFSFNPRAIHAYKKAGFRQEGILRDAIKDGGSFADDILMAILEDEWRSVKKEEQV